MDWEKWFWAILTAPIAWLVKMYSGMMSQISDVREQMPKYYVHKSDHNRDIDRIENAVANNSERIERKVDEILKNQMDRDWET